MAEGVHTQDVVHFKTPLMKFISLETWNKFFQNKKYEPIMKTLNNIPMTVSEIHKMYPADKEAYKRTKNSQTTNKTVRTEKKKTETTIYRYIQNLIKVGLVSEVGRRIQSNQTSTKLLYSRSAELILLENVAVRVWNSEHGNLVVKTLGLIINRHYGHKFPSVSRLKRLLLDYETESSDLGINLLKQIAQQPEPSLNDKNKMRAAKKIINSINGLGARDLYYFQTYLILINWLLSKQENELLIKLETIFRDDIEDRDIQAAQTTTETSLKEPAKPIGSQDFIHFTPAVIKISDVEKWNQYFREINYWAILSVLHSDPMTIKEIHKQYNEIVKKHSNEPFKEKKEHTVYQYVQELIKAGFVAKAGRRIFPNQSSTQLLYSTTAKVFYLVDVEIKFWASERGRKVAHAIGSTLGHYLQKKTNSEKLYELLLNFVTIKANLLEQVLITVTEEYIIDPIRLFSSHETHVFLITLGLLEWYITQDIKALSAQIQKCFTD